LAIDSFKTAEMTVKGHSRSRVVALIHAISYQLSSIVTISITGSVLEEILAMSFKDELGDLVRP